MKIKNVENRFRSILLDDGHFLFKLKKKSTSSTWSYFNKNTKGITLIALIITIILMLILSGVVISLTLGDNGIFKLAKVASKNYINAAEDEKSELNNIQNNIDNVYATLENIENAEEIQNYEMLYDGNAKTEEEKEAIEITGGWIDVTSNSTSSYGKGTKRITKNQNSINFYAVNAGAVPGVAINRNIGSMDFYKIYTKFTGKASTEKYTGDSMMVVFLNTDPTKSKFSIYGGNDNRIDTSKYGAWYKGSSYDNMILSTYKPTNDNAHLYIGMSLYSANLSSYSYSSDMQNCWIVKQDDYNQLAKIAQLEGEYESVEKLLTQEALGKICNSEKASEYLVKKCTGDIMCELLSNDEAIGYLSSKVKKEMISNKNWSKFIKIYEKENLFE